MTKASRSILFIDDAAAAESAEVPEILRDLNLDQIIDGVIAGREEYQLGSFFHAPLRELDEILYRQEAMADLEDGNIRVPVQQFAAAMQRVREELGRAGKLYYRLQQQWWFVDAVELYCGAVSTLAEALSGVAIASRAFQGLRNYLAEYTATTMFGDLGKEARSLKERLAAIRYSLIIKDDSLSVRPYDGEADYSIAVEETFRKFAQGEGKDYRIAFKEPIELNHVEAPALDLVARLNPDLFAAVEQFATAETHFLNETIRRFDREVQFYLSWLDYIRDLEQAGLPFCVPRLQVAEKQIAARDAFDLALAKKLSGAGERVVGNDFELEGRERIIIVSGPNNGGKTTFARMFGQMHYLARLGCKVPGREALLLLSDAIFTHFEREEKVENLRSKFEGDLLRVRGILEGASGRSIVVMNESFSSTSLKDAAFIGRKVLQRIIDKDLVCLFVTFVEELAQLSDTTVSMVSTIVPGDPASRTFKVVRKPADGRAYAIAVAEKCRLTYSELRKRIGR